MEGSEKNDVFQLAHVAGPQVEFLEKQSVLLHILETEHPDVRVICTAEPELLKMVTEKTFRPNLFFILRQSDIAVPSLKDTTEDIPEIADFFLKRYAAKTGKQRKHLDASAIKALKLYRGAGFVIFSEYVKADFHRFAQFRTYCED